MQDVKVIGSFESKFESTNRIYDEGWCSPTLSTMQGGNKEPKILQASSIRMVRTEEGKALRKQYENHELQHGFNEYREPELRKDGTSNTLTSVQKDNLVMQTNNCIDIQYRIRKLTPRECWRLMDFKDYDFEKAQEVNSNTQLYKQAGNSIVKNVLVAIFGQMIDGKENVYKEVV